MSKLAAMNSCSDSHSLRNVFQLALTDRSCVFTPRVDIQQILSKPTFAFNMGIKNKRKASVAETSFEQSPKKLKGEQQQPAAVKEKKVKKDKAKKVNLTKKQDIELSPTTVAAETSITEPETTPIVKLRKPRTKKVEGEVKEPQVEKKPLSKRSKRSKAKKAAAAVEVTPKDAALYQEKSLEYLELWKNDREAWKFHKLRQIWLVDNMLDSSKVSDDVFPTLLEYIAGSKGNLVEMVTTKITAGLKVMEESKDVDVESAKYTRSRTIIQTLATT